MKGMKHHSSPKQRRQRRVRAKIYGTAARPRLVFVRGVAHSSAQIINDELGTTLASVYEYALNAKDRKATKTLRAAALGSLMAQAAASAGITAVIFDRRASKYHGRIKAFADAARHGGLHF